MTQIDFSAAAPARRPAAGPRRALPRATCLATITLLAGCAHFQTRPGTPDSYRVGLGFGNYYQSSGLQNLEWPTGSTGTNGSGKNVNDLQLAGVPIRDVPPVYKASAIPREIWQARGAAWNLHLKYLAASFKAGEVQDAIAVPLFGSAIATAALGIARASTVSIAATGLGGMSIYAGYNYLHPDKDLTADQTAAFALVCVVDQSLPLRTMSAIPLMLDKAALQDALDQLAIDSGPLMMEPSPSTADKATQQAVTAAQSAAKQTMTNLDTNINLYDNMPSLLYTVVDQIDKTAQTGGTRSLDYSGILSSLQASVSNKSANNAAQNSVTQAAQAGTAAAAAPSGANAQAVSQSKSPDAPAASPNTNLDSITTPASGGTISALATSQPDAAAADPGKAGSNQVTATSLSATLNSPLSDLQKVTKLANDANEDLAVVDYPTIQANLQACPTGQTVAPVVTPQTPPASTPAKTGS